MTLSSTAKMSEVIATLTDLQGINQKAELASVVGSPAASTDTIAAQVSKIQTIKNDAASKLGVSNTTPLGDLIASMSGNKKWASGTAESTNSPIRYFTYLGSSSTNSAYYIEVTDLTFKPSIIIIRSSSGSISFTMYDPRYSLTACVITGTTAGSTTTNVTSYKGNSGESYVNETGFRLPAGTSGSVTWYAFE